MELDLLSNLHNKNVFIFDTETTGLPERVPHAVWGSSSEYWLYSMNDKYDKSRIVSMAWSSYNNFTKEQLTANNIQYHIRYPEGFTEIPTTHIHGISYDEAVYAGKPFNDIFENRGLYNDLINADYIIAHNVFFDIHILLNELYRLNTPLSQQTIAHILNLIELNRCICTGNISKNICKLSFSKSFYPSNKKQKLNNYKMPKLAELYKYYYNTDITNAHNAAGDVNTLQLCLVKLLS